jgi:hypothetical protein
VITGTRCDVEQPALSGRLRGSRPVILWQRLNTQCRWPGIARSCAVWCGARGRQATAQEVSQAPSARESSPWRPSVEPGNIYTSMWTSGASCWNGIVAMSTCIAPGAAVPALHPCPDLPQQTLHSCRCHHCSPPRPVLLGPSLRRHVARRGVVRTLSIVEAGAQAAWRFQDPW